jgi:ribosome-associated protein|tara:strand:+ start:1162 stop:1653 length:492 start_codon:yes stop_codon:yes gene_type:complete
MLDIDKEVVVSKTELKKDSKKIQAFGKKISELTVKNIETFKFSPNIYEAIIGLKNIKSNAAKKRQVQYVGKLLREIDLTHAFLIIEQLKVSSQKEIQQNHSIEKWRDELLINADSITQFFNQYPNIDRQSLRQAITNAQRERKEKKSPKYSRQLFKLLREIII